MFLVKSQNAELVGRACPAIAGNQFEQKIVGNFIEEGAILQWRAPLNEVNSVTNQASALRNRLRQARLGQPIEGSSPKVNLPSAGAKTLTGRTICQYKANILGLTDSRYTRRILTTAVITIVFIFSEK